MFLRYKKLLFWGGFALIFMITFIVYYPSFEHLLRGETYTYLLDTKGHTSIYDLITGWYNYEKVRLYDPGDFWLFKPLLFIIVGIEKALFGVNYIYWRIASFIMHMVAVLSLYRLLWRIKKGILAVSATLFFAVLYMLVNTVLYEQIASYALFTALVINSLYYLYIKKGLKWAILSMIVASFINETGIIIAGIFVGYLWLMRESFNVNWKRWANSFTLLIPFYFIVYFAEKFISPASGIGTEFGNLASVKTVLVGLVNVPNILWTWVKYILFPSMYNLIPQENLRSYSSIIVEATSSLILWNAGAILGIFGVTALSLGRKQKYQFTSLIVYLLLVFVAVISVFRTNTHGALYVLRNGYNSYMFGAWFILLIYLLISRAKAQWVLTVLLLVPTCLSGMMVFNMNQSIKEGEQPLRAYFAYIDDFVQEHKGENDFTFRATIDSPLEKGLAFPLVRVVNKAQIHENHSIPEALYEEYWDSGTPKYILEYSPSTNRVEVK